MISISVKRSHKAILELVIQDHAGYGAKGEDLVCAGVSAIAIGALNALDQKKQDVCELELRDAYIKISVHQPKDQEAQLMLEMLMIQLQTVKERYPNFIHITKQEVA
ncbi:MAG: ribosomal-processing cysteine protease Prp [Erysipelotrichaceae bacterium]|nr:ribosomal-processing cysteine protease Prp [Erysipelotrichaceae bacterium]MCI9312088.1 ribosomal-processing cysteine protease Prp [Erysipelotrichaceae bacterium]